MAAMAACCLVLAPIANGADSGGDARQVRQRELPQRWQAQRVDGPDGMDDVYVVQAGPADAQTVLLVHGLGRSGYRDWWSVIDELEEDYRVVALDLPGFGRSPVPDGPLSPPRYARLLALLHQRLSLGRVRLVGHSMGAAVALYYAAAYPDHVEQAVLADVAGVLQRVAFLRGVLSQQRFGGDLPGLIGQGMRALVDSAGGMLERLVLDSDLDVVEVLRRSQTAWNALIADRANANAAVSLLETDYSGVVATYDHPTTVMGGAQDRLVPRRTASLLSARLPAGGPVFIGGADHTPMRSRSGQFNARLREAFANNASGQEDIHGDAAGTGRQRGEWVCQGRSGPHLSGTFERVTLRNCSKAELIDVRAGSIRVIGSSRVRMRHVEVTGEGDGAGLAVINGGVIATDVTVKGDPAVRVDSGRVDMAGADLSSPGGGIAVDGASTLVFSVTRLASSKRAGYLHGAMRARGEVVDTAAGLVSTAEIHRGWIKDAGR
jgi:pimeloyl-ACP methyl ester carboxylesterase